MLILIIAATLAVAVLFLTLKWALWLMFAAIALFLQPLLFLALLIPAAAILYFIYRQSARSKFNHHSRFNQHSRSHSHVISKSLVSKLPVTRD